MINCLGFRIEGAQRGSLGGGTLIKGVYITTQGVSAQLGARGGYVIMIYRLTASCALTMPKPPPAYDCEHGEVGHLLIPGQRHDECPYGSNLYYKWGIGSTHRALVSDCSRTLVKSFLHHVGHVEIALRI